MLTKRFQSEGPVCKVDFTLPADIAAHAQTAHLVGDFNAWDETATPMKKLKGPKFKVTLELAVNRDYAFRYLVNGVEWHNDPEADHFVAHPFGGTNSVISTYPPQGPE